MRIFRYVRAGRLVVLAHFAVVAAFGQSAPSITTQPTSQTVLSTSNAVFSVVASGQTPLSYQWNRNGAALIDGGHIVGATNAALTVTTAAGADAGSYRCTVANRHGSVTSSSAMLTVILPPTISAIPNQKMFPNGASRTLAFTVNDPQNATVTVTASSSNTAVLPNSNLVVSGSGSNRTLTITAGAAKGTASVSVAVQDSFGLSASTSFEITFADFTDIGAPLTNLINGTIQWVDYDNDGYLDLFIYGNDTNAQPQSALYHNNHDGTFTTVNSGLPGGIAAAWADFNNDGFLDVVVGWGVYRNNGDGTFTPMGGPRPIDAVAWGDYDNDGKPDVVVSGIGYAAVYHNEGNGVFRNIGAGLQSTYDASVTWADYDGDGYLDILLTGNPQNNQMVTHLYHNRGDGTFEDKGLVLPGVSGRNAVAWGDYNNDGKIDVLLTASDSVPADAVLIFRNYGTPGDPTFVFGGFFEPVPGLNNAAVGWADFDNDGRLDFFAGGLMTNDVDFFSGLYRNNGTNSFVNVGASIAPIVNGSISWGDYDNDGALDLAVMGAVSNATTFNRVYHNDGAMPDMAPTAPTGLTATVSNLSVTFSWNPASDAEQTGGLSYNLRIGTTPGGMDILAPNADVNTGKRRIAQIGNAGYRTSWTLKLKHPGTYYWSVQAIDHSFAGSQFASEQSFQKNPPTSKSQLLDVDFSGSDSALPIGPISVKHGLAAVGQGSNDFWNFYDQNAQQGRTDNLMTQLLWADGSIAPATMEVMNSRGWYPSGSSDPMLARYLYGYSTLPLTVNVFDLPLGTYDFYIYGHEATDGSFQSYPQQYQLFLDNTFIGARTNSNLHWNTTNWQEGLQYVAFHNVTISEPHQVSIVCLPNQSSSGVIAGLQIASQPLLPAVWLQPTNVVVGVGTNAYFSATPIGTVPLTNRWLFNGAPLVDDGRIVGANTTTLTINSVQPGDDGSYSLAVSNIAGSTTSAVAMLDVRYPPTVTQPPQSQTVNGGDTTVFTVDANGSNPISYQWYFGATKLTNAARYSGVTAAALTIANSQFIDRGNYSVVLSNAFGTTTSAAATLDVLVPPIFVAQPPSQTVGIGSNAVFTATVTGTAPQTNQWLFSGAPLSDGGNITGATTASLTVGNIQGSDEGTYSLLVSNAIGSTTSANATLTLGYAPTITQQPSPQTAIAGSNTSFTVTATGSDVLTYQWYLGSQLLTNDTRHSAATTATLSITNVLASDVGSYTVVVTNAFGAATSSNASLVVWTRPSITKPPIGRSVPRGLPTVFSGTASGTVPVSYQWRFNGVDIPGATASTYTVSAVNDADLGSYTLTASNIAGTVTSSNALLTFGPVAPWGDNIRNEGLPPAGLTNVVSVAASQVSDYALLSDGSVVKWGTSPGTSSLTNVVAISISDVDTGIALRSDGSAIGINRVVPTGWTNMIAVAAAGGSSYALRSDGTVVNSSQIVPSGLVNVTSIAGSSTEVLALRNDGTVAIWNANGALITPPSPLTNIVAISAGFNYWFAVKSDGHIVGQGTNVANVVPPEATNVVAVAANPTKTSPSVALANAALRADGTVVAWGATTDPAGPGPVTNAITPSSISNAVAIAVGAYNGLALINDGSPQLLHPPVGGTAYSGNDFTLKATAVGAPQFGYQWSFNGTPIQDATNTALTITNIQSANAGTYQLIVTNALGSVSSVPVPVNVMDRVPFFTVQPISRTVYLGSSVNLGVPVSGSAPMTFTWRHGIGASPRPDITTSNSSLVLNPALASDTGTYTLIVSNAFGSVTSATVSLTIRQVVAWGDNTYGKTNVPTLLTNAIAVCGGDFYNSLALRADGIPLVWGFSSGSGISPFGLSNIMEIAAAPSSTLETYFGLRTDGSVAYWFGGATPNTLAVSNVVAIEADTSSLSLLMPDGTVLRRAHSALTNAPFTLVASNVVGLCPFDNGYIALRADGTLLSSRTGTLPPPPPMTNVQSITASSLQGTALKRNGTVQSWDNTNAPAGSNFIAVATTSETSAAVDAAGNIFAWRRVSGGSTPGTNVPPGLGRVGIMDGGYNGFVALLTTNEFAPIALGDSLNTSGLVVSSHNSAQWFGQTNVTHDGISAAQSAQLGKNTASSMRMLVTNGPITMGFWWKVSSLTNHSFLTFSIGGVPQASISGDVDWQQVSFTVPAGPQMLVWTYSKDSSGTDGMDAGFVDQLSFTAIAPTLTSQPASQTILGGPAISFNADVYGTAPLSYSWFNNVSGTPISTLPVFTISPTYRSSSGTYYLVVSNIVGSARSTNFVLTVRVPQLVGVPQLQPDGTFLLTSQDADKTLFSSGADLSRLQLQYSSNLVDWLPLTAPLSISNGLMQVIDSDATNAPQRFYRIIEGW